MEDGERWRVMEFTAGVQDKTIINRIMLRFRPIAPKPVTGESSSGAWMAENKNSRFVPKGRTKRKYVRVKTTKKNDNSDNNQYNQRRSTKLSADQEREREDDGSKLPTLQLLPERNDLVHQKSSPTQGSWSGTNNNDGPQQVFHLNCQVLGDTGGSSVSDPAERRKAEVVETWVTAECVIDTCMDMEIEEEGLGSTDVEKMKNLERDTCPAFLSDGSNYVQWVNDAYKRMVVAVREDINESDGGGRRPEIMVRLVIKEKLLPYLHSHRSAFSCWVGLQFTACSLKVPCDVWKMEFGGFAWRLDMKAALKLGL